MRWTQHRSSVAAITITTSVAGLVIVVSPATAEAKEFGSAVSFACTRAGSGQPAEKVTVRLTGSVKERVAPGKPVRFSKLGARIVVPAALAESFVGPEPGPVTGSATLTTTARQNGQTADLGWPDLVLTAAPGGGAGLAFTGAIAVPDVIPSVAGTIDFAAESLALSLRQESTTPDTAAGKAETPLTCTPEGKTSIARVQVTTPGAQSGRSGRSGPLPNAAADEPAIERCTHPKGERDNSLFSEPWPNETVSHDTGEGQPPQLKCGKLVGYSNVRKLGGAAPVGAGLQADTTIRRVVDDQPSTPDNPHNWQVEYHLAATEAASSTATMLGFGFMPTTVKTQITQDRLTGIMSFGRIYGNRDSLLPARTLSYANSKVKVKVSEIRVNGLPINPGTACSNVGEMLLKLKGDLPPGAGVTTGGTYKTVENALLEIPRFTGCGVSEDLSPLLTASTSGSGNHVSVFQSQLCDPGDALEDCNDTPQEWKVSPLGATLRPDPVPFAVTDPTTGATITCPRVASTVTTVPEVLGAQIGRIGFTRPTANSCSGTNGITGISFTTVPSLSMFAQEYDPKTQISRIVPPSASTFIMSYMVPRATGTGTVRCEVRPNLRWDIFFNNTSHTFSLRHRPAVLSSASTAPECNERFAVGRAITTKIDPLVTPEVTITAKLA
ncbi:hypothetical protein ACGFNU_31980 [Spirillospora sp. NPDC048911]|uniref:hypothetical protein n=1 Tax=Spirillospora sp. NPDC048911 TaxID=3364527 RepID=UPI00372403E5